MKRIRIFISSVQSEFAEERAMLSQYIRTDALLGKFFETFIFEDVPANEASPQQVYLNEVEMADIYLGLYGNKYGYEDEEGVSPTEREYDRAAELHKTRLVFIKSIDEEHRHSKEATLIRKVERDIVRKTFVDTEGLRTSVYASLVRYLEEKETQLSIRMLSWMTWMRTKCVSSSCRPGQREISHCQKIRHLRNYWHTCR